MRVPCVFLLICMAVGASACQPPILGVSAPIPDVIGLAPAVPPLEIEVTGISRSKPYSIVKDHQGQLFVAVILSEQKDFFAIYKDGKQQARVAVPWPEDTRFDKLIGLCDAQGRVWFIWSCANPYQTAAAYWQKDRFSSVMELYEYGRSDLTATVDTQGRLHVAFPQSGPGFSLGGHLAYTSLCYHMIFDGTAWSAPKATQMWGRFTQRDLRLEPGSDGGVFLFQQVSQFGLLWRELPYIGVQWYVKGQWSPVHQVSGSGKDISWVAANIDPAGKVILWWDFSGFGSSGVGITSLTDNSTLSHKLKFEDNSYSSSIRRLPNGLMVAHNPGNNIARFWNGREWSKKFKTPKGTLEQITPEGHLLLADIDNNKLIIHELRLSLSLPKTPVAKENRENPDR
ncbi:MAG: hypothetical protein K8S55_02290 [Phycisphaerae bacterium]|nr:hypothetical protein [Phycisphaerae bacterium]